MHIKFEDVVQRLKTKLDIDSDAALARELGISPPAFTERKRRGNLPYDAIIEVCRKRGISLDYLITGISEELSGKIIYAYDIEDIDEEKMIVVPYFSDIRCAAGSGCTNDDSSTDEISYIVLPRDGYPELSKSERHLHAVTAHGDSMEGTIYDGAILLVDFHDKGSESGRIYIVNSNGEVMVKRLFNDPSAPEKILLRSDNIYYPQFTVDRNELDVIGRVVFVYNRAKLV